MAYQLIDPRELAAFHDALRRQGRQPADFELEEEVFDPATAEVEAALGELGVKCLKTNAVTVYRLGPGTDWLGAFEDDLRQGRLGDSQAMRGSR